MNAVVSLSRTKRVSARAICALALAITVGMGLVQADQAIAQSTQEYFTGPEQAGQALADAVRSNDDFMLATILGPEAPKFSSGDQIEDTNAQKAFVRKYDVMHRWARLSDGSEILYVGADNYAYPFPLKQQGAQGWHFDGFAGTDEIQARRIGGNELLAMDAVNAIAGAEQAYKVRERQYTARIISQPGAQDGLYWQTGKDESPSPLGDLRDVKPCTSCVGGSQVFDGYTFRILTAQQAGANTRTSSYVVNGKMTDGFAVLASPISYGNTGIMSFLIDRDGVLYQKDLGATTTAIASAIHTYNPKDGWEVAN
jgi:Protein of unknown function (DUF2950)